MRACVVVIIFAVINSKASAALITAHSPLCKFYFLFKFYFSVTVIVQNVNKSLNERALTGAKKGSR